ncbi:MAG: DUF2892 domain-containing protein [Acidithiobacillus sp.]|nr:DUF2892 domain-containing protein [Acidithiobacillus sp.]
MTTENWVRFVAGIFVMLSVALGAPASPVFVSQWFLAFTLFVGLNLFQSSLSGFCPLVTILHRMGVRDSASCSR